MVTALARLAIKIIFFFMITVAVARSLGHPENYADHEFVSQLSLLLTGDVNAESLYDAYFYIDFFIVFAISLVFYSITMMLIRKKRRK
ncbi:hypothetical protein [Pantoea ananatis]|jgi:uncharacterized membrane protein YcaP (DUF421 family)|uniref:hypothetical protein n=1 Tax=Pantoea ananas TaxID=553 RepID=UPI0021E80D7C|nr:hypothetical protein [Pantoea ananatis]MCW0309967.1 hypothetical protein [Pantoea ananatis]MCW0341677.1 hypothetical protein [Pantoea ananatis]MCW0360174.1 hypothetical protein [Pantoea ananatis]MCW0364801.1 hypothetical protein [Pantoea ananatis]MCW1777415.1 hypothetical protein [Pantoea ananatis]